MDFYNTEYDALQLKIWELENHIRSFRPKENSAIQWVSLIKKYTQIEALDVQTLFSLVERIVISDVPTMEANESSKDIKIIYKYVGDISGLNLDELSE